MKQSQHIIVVIPAYNEAGRIGSVLSSIPQNVRVKNKSFAVHTVVVDDGSTDATADEARMNGATVIRHVINCGAGAATRTGLHYAQKHGQEATYVIAIDADGQHAPQDIKKMLVHAVETGADMVVGNRLHAGNKQNIPLHRTIGNHGLTMISRILFGIKIADTQTGFRLFKPSVLPVVANYSIDRYGFATEMLWQATKARLNIHELPIAVTYSRETLQKGQNVWGGVDLIANLLWIRISR